MGGAIPYQFAMIIYAIFTYFVSWDKIDCDSAEIKKEIEDKNIEYLIDQIDWDKAYDDVKFMVWGHGIYITMYICKKILTKKTDC